MKMHLAKYSKLNEKFDNFGRFWDILRWFEANKRLPILMEILGSHKIWICKRYNYTAGDHKALLNLIGHCLKDLKSQQEKSDIINYTVLLFELKQTMATPQTDTAHHKMISNVANDPSELQLHLEIKKDTENSTFRKCIAKYGMF